MVVETEPGVVLGIGRHHKLPMMYTADVRSGKVLQRKPLSQRAKRLIARGPDGRVYIFLKDTLVRVDPQTLREEQLGRMEPARMLFVGSDLYLAGTSQLRRIVGVAVRK